SDRRCLPAVRERNFFEKIHLFYCKANALRRECVPFGTTQEGADMMTREGAGVAIDEIQLNSSLFALIPVPVAVIDQIGCVILSNSAFADLFHDIQNIQSVPHHELELTGRGTYEL